MLLDLFSLLALLTVPAWAADFHVNTPVRRQSSFRNGCQDLFDDSRFLPLHRTLSSTEKRKSSPGWEALALSS